jgi:hypothetical protein
MVWTLLIKNGSLNWRLLFAVRDSVLYLIGTQGREIMSREKPQADTVNKHPEEYQRDLNPNAMAGQNIGVPETGPEDRARTAYDIKAVHRKFDHLLDADLKQIRVLPAGSRLEQGATYFDLNNPDQGEFTATGDMEAGSGNWYVAKTDTHYNLWNLLIGVDNPDRLGTTRE